MSWFVRTAAVIGDFGNPFYDEERRRDVWNEASAVGLQVVLWTGLVAAAVVVWVLGAPAVPYALGLLAVLGVACIVTIAYARALGVEIDDPKRLSRLRVIPYVAVLIALVVGIVRSGALSLSAPFVVGAVVGTAAVLAAVLIGSARARRRERSAADT